ncbi:hypothetical protein M3Y98_00196600 [Aphelenchoides besseyi]|nr:hypothetical protein M3Y98_00196600 [Aphelenchoides besseyi]KAI6200259.1 hypothetical protein M3Y96_00714400 [Aphelenchoides besseyi]
MHISVNPNKVEKYRSTLLGFLFGVVIFVLFTGFVYWLRWDNGVVQEMNANDFQREFWAQFIKDSRRARVELAVSDLPHFNRQVGSCSRFMSGAHRNETKSWRYDEARSWKFDDETFMEHQLGTQKKFVSCSSIIDKFAFLEEPLSTEEAEYPLAYGMIVYKNAAQVYYSLSAIYQPQNAYCIAVDGKSASEFKQQMRDLAECLPHITVIEMPRIGWCGRSVLKAQFQCFQNLTHSQHPWKYYQYYTGFDVPLKTNLEMVRIFKQLNNTVVCELAPVVSPRPQTTENILPIYKAGMSALVPRESARYVLNNTLVNTTVNHLFRTRYNICPDELLWATIFGNKKLVPAPGSFEAAEMQKKLTFEKWEQDHNSRNSRKHPDFNVIPNNEEPFRPENYMISRFQIWESSLEKCHGAMTDKSCAFGLGDIPTLIERSELVAHKFHLEVEPAAYFCMWKYIRERALDPNQEKFQGHNYRHIAQVRLNSGESINKLSIYYNEY